MVGFDPQNPDFGSTVQESFGRLTFMRTIGATLERVSPGDVDIALPFRDASGRRRSQPSEGTASVTEMNCEVDLEQELIAAHTRTNLNELENRILISTLTEHHPDHLIVSDVRIDVTERVSVEQFPIGTKLVSRSRTRSKATRGSPKAFGEVLTEP